MYEIIMYDTKDGDCPVKSFLDSLEPKLLAKTLRTIDLLEKKWPRIGRNPFQLNRRWNIRIKDKAEH